MTSFAELVLGNEASDYAHPAFSKMFVETEIAPNKGAIFATRRKREKNEPDLTMAHFVTDPSGPARDAEAETDRRAFIGRGRTIVDATAFIPAPSLGATPASRWIRSQPFAGRCACPPTRRYR
ncbi:hypothetical protein AJ88_07350 [Mesorhizobium amorphae CCBAU 01583]|nr:hypothetical protein AJ88_07350 [Mesorhizobium amorphae CCBAU 01583]